MYFTSQFLFCFLFGELVNLTLLFCVVQCLARDFILNLRSLLELHKI